MPVNSLWLWGGGCQPAECATSLPIYARRDEALALATFCNTPVHALPAQLDSRLLAADGVILLDALTTAGQNGDAYGWREALRELERDWFAPLQRTLRKLGPQGLRLIDPVSGKALHLRAGSAWKFWRRSERLISMLA